MSFRIILFSLLNLYFLNCNAQETNILTCLKKKKGLYKDFNEFKRNSPYDTSTQFELKMPNKNPERYTLFRLLNGENTKIKNGIWGFCDGKDVYVCVSSICPGNWFVKIYEFGYYCIFTEQLKSSGGGLVGALIQQQANKGKKYFEIYVVDFSNGEIKEVNKNTIKMLLVDDDELYSQYNADPEGKNKFLKYMLDFNEHNKSRYPISSSE